MTEPEGQSAADVGALRFAPTGHDVVLNPA